MQLFGVLHVALGERQSPNVRASSAEHNVEIYVRNAVSLARSLRERGVPFSLLTNDGEAVRAAATRCGIAADLDVVRVKFSLPVPSGVPFYSAHFKLDAYRYLAQLPTRGLVGLVDLDMVAVRQPPPVLNEMENCGRGLYYDISDQVIPAFGRSALLSDMRQVDPGVIEGRWCGGEFLCGSPSFFGELFGEIEGLFPKYAEVAGRLRFGGDEIVTSIAIERLRRRGLFVGDAGTLGVVGRYWSSVPRHPQKPFRYFHDCFLLHLPADKRLLANLRSAECAQASAFLRRYRKHLLLLGPRRVAQMLLKRSGSATD